MDKTRQKYPGWLLAAGSSTVAQLADLPLKNVQLYTEILPKVFL